MPYCKGLKKSLWSEGGRIVKKKYICAGLFDATAILLMSSIEKLYVLSYLPTKFSVVVHAITYGAAAAALLLNNRKIDYAVCALTVIAALTVLGGTWFWTAKQLVGAILDVVMLLLFAASSYSKKAKLSYMAGGLELLGFVVAQIWEMVASYGGTISFGNELVVVVPLVAALILRGKLYANTEKETAQTKEVKE